MQTLSILTSAKNNNYRFSFEKTIRRLSEEAIAAVLGITLATVPGGSKHQSYKIGRSAFY